ncbi:MAG TPA: glycosyltransferase family 2 protein [Syntrophothermus lipocalidus]|nr:glycosyltransferase family 2 protein [Syntrophothermus lipocalidus]
MLEVSVIIPTYNRSQSLHEVIGSYLSQASVREIIIVDDGSTEDYESVIREANLEAAKRGIKLVYLRNAKRQGAPAARNLGVQVATGDLILFSDDDVFLDESFLQIGIAKLIHLNADIIGGRIQPVGSVLDVSSAQMEDIPLGRVFDPLTVRGNWSVKTPRDLEVPFVSAVSLWRRWPFDKGVRFDEGYGGNGYREETSAQISAAKLGAIIVFSSDLVAWHIGRKSGGQWRGGRLWWYYWAVRNNLRFLLKEYSFLRAKHRIAYPLLVVFIAFCIRQLAIFIPANFKTVLKRFIGSLLAGRNAS